jgi:hypothetical protein
MGCEYLARDHAAEQCKATLPNINASDKRLMFQSIRLGAMELQGVARAKEATLKPYGNLAGKRFGTRRGSFCPLSRYGRAVRRPPVVPEGIAITPSTA